ncbi:hypothetical protein [Microvirga puerhi]|uniref:MBG domain-containing protein n=1 Tax=Microvirga puerhi TaxID=2876078 RepID=A0ABS7VK87_9HYPH|nr:hypothetical protein [Microvirga puerhi]MBZ6075948.1 hypothetical protein [Microvirga puerhi]
MPSPITITADQSTTFTLVADYSSVTDAAGVTITGPDTSTGFAIDATAGAGGTISVYGTLTAGGGIYDPTSTRPGYNVTIYKQGSINATMGYGIALQKQATVINYGEITAHQVGISLGAGESIAINDGSIAADVGIQAFGDNTIIDNGGMIDAATNGIVVRGGTPTRSRMEASSMPDKSGSGSTTPQGSRRPPIRGQSPQVSLRLGAAPARMNSSITVRS